MNIRSGPLAGRYPFVATMAILALVPYLALSTSLTPLIPFIEHDLHMSAQTVSLGLGMANAGYALGTVLAVLFAQHLPQRLMLVVYSAAALAGSVLAASAHDPAMFIAGHILQGLCTSLLLISAVPPLALGFGMEKLKYTAVIMSLCIFGAVAAGPVFGGLQAHAHAWRPLLWIAAGVSALVVVLVVLTYDHTPPANRQAPKDPVAIGLAAAGSVAAFFGASELTTHAFLSTQTTIPLFGGLLLIVALVVWETRSRNPLLPLGPLLKSTIPVTGVVIALCAAAASVSVSDLTLSLVTGQHGALRAGELFLPELAGALISALILGWVLERKYLQYLPMVGMLFLAAGIAVFLIKVPSDQTLTLVGSGLTGLGLGGTVAPALFGAGFSLPAANLQRVFAMVELLRGVAAFMIAPIFVHLVVTVGGSSIAGTRDALWISLAIVVGGSILALSVYFAGGARPRTPQIDSFLSGEGSAWPSPPLLALLRRAPRTASDPRPAAEPELRSARSPANGAGRDPDAADARAWAGRTLVDRNGERIGRIVKVYADGRTREPDWAMVASGFLGTRTRFLPLSHASPSRRDLLVPVTRREVKRSPAIEAERELSDENERELFEHYRVPYTEAGSIRARLGMTGPTVADGAAAHAATGAVGGAGIETNGSTTDGAMTRYEEEVLVGTRYREAGRVRLRKYVVTEQVTTTVELRREEVRIEREPITDADHGAATAGAELSEQECEVVLHAEELVIEKRVVPKERVRLVTDTVIEHREVSEPVRKERIVTEAGTDAERTR